MLSFKLSSSLRHSSDVVSVVSEPLELDDPDPCDILKRYAEFGAQMDPKLKSICLSTMQLSKISWQIRPLTHSHIRYIRGNFTIEVQLKSSRIKEPCIGFALSIQSIRSL